MIPDFTRPRVAGTAMAMANLNDTQLLARLQA
jgi:hypothetical protein